MGYGIPAGHGADDAGDLVVELQIVLPAVRDERSKELLREFGRLNDTNVRGHLFGDSRSGRIAEDNAEGT